MKYSIIILLTLTWMNTASQNQTDCEELLSTKLPFNDPVQFQDKFSNLQNCGLEPIDIEIFSNKSNKNLLATILLRNLKGGRSNEFTYRYLLAGLLEFKKTNQYIDIKESTIASKELETRIASLKEWEQDSLMIAKLHLPKSHMAAIHELVKQNSGTMTYKEIITAAKSYNNLAESTNVIPIEVYLFQYSGNVNFEELLSQANTLKKPLLIYFSSYACVNSRKMESEILHQEAIYSKLKHQFYLVTLYLDDREMLRPSENIISSVTGKQIETVGQKHSNMQIEKFGTDIRPYFVILNPDGDLILAQGFTNDVDSFNEFLNKGLKN